MRKLKILMFLGLTFIFSMCIFLTGYCVELLTLSEVRHGSYPYEQRTRIAFDFLGNIPQYRFETDSALKEVRIFFEKATLKDDGLNTRSFHDERVDSIDLHQTERGIEVTIRVKVPFEIQSGEIRDKIKIVYFDFREKRVSEPTLTPLESDQKGIGSVSGRIFDNLSGKSLSGVQISIPDQGLESVSDAKGDYSFSEVSTGSVSIIFTTSGYMDEKRTISVVESQETILNIALNRAETVVTPTLSPQPISPPEPINRFQNQEALEYFQLGEYHFQSNHLFEAVDAYQKAIEYDPEYADAYYKLGISLGKLGHHEDGILALEKSIQLNPRNANAYNALGAIYGMSQQYEKAIEQFKKAVEIDSQLSLAYNNMGILYGKIGQHQKAIEVLKKAIQIDPQSAESNGALGVAYAMAGKPQEAIDPLIEAIRIDPTYAKAYFNLGITYLWLGDIHRAEEQCEILESLDSAMAQDLQKEIEALKNQ